MSWKSLDVVFSLRTVRRRVGTCPMDRLLCDAQLRTCTQLAFNARLCTYAPPFYAATGAYAFLCAIFWCVCTRVYLYPARACTTSKARS